jgi:hypothetical protein
LKTLRILTYCPGGAEQQDYWQEWASLLGQLGGLSLDLEHFQRREDWIAALRQREGEAGLLGAACTLQDMESNGGQADLEFLDGLVQRGLPVLMCSRNTLEVNLEKLPLLCQRQWQLLSGQFGQRL